MFGGGTSQTWLWLLEPVKYVGEDVQGVHGEPQAFQWWAAGRHGWKFYRPLFSPFAMTGGIHGKQLFFNIIGDRLHPWCVGCSVHLNCVLKMCWKHCIPHSQTAVSELVAVLLRFSPLSPPRPKPARSCAMCHKELYLPVIACVCVRACTRTHAFSVLTGPHVGSCPCPFSSIEAWDRLASWGSGLLTSPVLHSIPGGLKALLLLSLWNSLLAVLGICSLAILHHPGTCRVLPTSERAAFTPSWEDSYHVTPILEGKLSLISIPCASVRPCPRVEFFKKILKDHCMNKCVNELFPCLLSTLFFHNVMHRN